MAIFFVTLYVPAYGLPHLVPVADKPALTGVQIDSLQQKLRNDLAAARTPADSVPILYNLLDLSISTGHPSKYIYSLIETAFRAGDTESALDGVRNLANLFVRNDSILDIAMEYARCAPAGDDRDQTVCFIRLMKNQHNINYADKVHKSAHLQELLRQVSLNPPQDIYDRIVLIHALCLHLTEVAEGDLLTEHVEKLNELINTLPSEHHVLSNAFYIWASMIYTRNGHPNEAIAASTRMLDEIDWLDGRNRRIGRIYRSYDDSRYQLYTRILENYKGLNDEELELYHDKALEMVSRSQRVAGTYAHNPMPCIFYSFAKKDYPVAYDLLKTALDYDRTGSYRRRIYLHMFIEAARAIGKDSELSAVYPEYLALLEDELNSRQQERYRELQVLYEVNDIRTENLKLQKEQQRSHKQLWQTVAWICCGVIILLALFVVTLWRLNRRKTQLARRLKASNLALRNESRSLREAEEQLRQARDEAQRANNLKTEFINNMSHEVKTPLQAIQEFSQIIIENVDDARRPYVEQFADRLLLNCDLVNTIVNDVLQLAELHNNTLKIKNGNYSAKNICDNALANMRLHLHDGVSLRLDPASVDFIIRTDNHRLMQILDNLLGNALKFTAKGTVTLSCTKSDDNRHAIFTVTDTGIGISADQKEMIFERFTKLDNSTSGVGLGLTISRMLATLMRGTLELDTAYTGGARFILTLPLD